MLLTLCIAFVVASVLSLGIHLLIKSNTKGHAEIAKLLQQKEELEFALAGYANTQIQNCTSVSTNLTVATLYSNGLLTSDPSLAPFTTRFVFSTATDASSRILPYKVTVYFLLTDTEFTKRAAAAIGATKLNTSTNEFGFDISLKPSSKLSRYSDYVQENSKSGNWCFESI